MKIKNVLAWCANAERANKNAIANTSTGGYLKDAIAIIRRQHDEIQKARNDLIDATAMAKGVLEKAEHERIEQG